MDLKNYKHVHCVGIGGIGQVRQVGIVLQSLLVLLILEHHPHRITLEDGEHPRLFAEDDRSLRQAAIDLPEIRGEVAHHLAVAVALLRAVAVHRRHPVDGALVLAQHGGNPPQVVFFLVHKCDQLIFSKNERPFII